MTQPRLTAEFQPMAAEGRAGLERVWHEGPTTTIDITAYVIGLDATGVKAFYEETARTSGKDLDHIADAIPGFVEANTGKGGFDVLIEDYEVADFFEAHGLDVTKVEDADLARLREEYGTAPGAQPTLAEPEAAAPGMR